jgi:release factor glutamine methyltransferase
LNFVKNINEKLNEATKILQVSEIAEPRREAKLLLAFALGKDQTFLIAHDDYVLSKTEAKRFDEFIRRRTQREPLQHITNNQEFYGLDFYVDKNVLIPRPETEMIVESALEILGENTKFCEVGVGSGCISVAILHELKSVSAVGLDISEKALIIAKRNAENHNVLERFTLQQSDIFSSLRDEKFDLICSNPPYISLDEIPHLQAEVGCFEPLNALTDGSNGFTIIEDLIKSSPQFLKSDGFLLIEIGFGQAERISGFILRDIWQKFDILPDLQGIPRMIRLQIY